MTLGLLLQLFLNRGRAQLLSTGCPGKKLVSPMFECRRFEWLVCSFSRFPAILIFYCREILRPIVYETQFISLTEEALGPASRDWLRIARKFSHRQRDWPRIKSGLLWAKGLCCTFFATACPMWLVSPGFRQHTWAAMREISTVLDLKFIPICKIVEVNQVAWEFARDCKKSGRANWKDVLKCWNMSRVEEPLLCNTN